jgi:hypothetical protein
MNTDLTTDCAAVSPAPEKRFDPVSIIGTSTACLVALLAIGAFALSYEALRDLAVRTGALSESTAWIFPLLVDGSIIVFSISALRASVIGAHKDRRWFLGLVVLVTLASVVLNVCHARGGILPGIIAALPPLFLFAAFESLMRQLQQSVAPVRPVARPKTKKGPSEKRSAPPEAESENRKGRALELKAGGMTNAAISRELGVSAATVSRYVGSKAA